MSRRFALLTLVLIAITALLAPPLAAEPSGPSTLICGGTTETGFRLVAPPFLAPTLSPQPVTLSDCPLVHNCPGNCNPQEGTEYDTGESSCGQGEYQCPKGQTIHVASGFCVKAPCCFQIHPCLCTNNCGFWQKFFCA
ncbi:MAG TPA: hypothetical protein VGS22_02575 [Thermoanaerobaculia bacterium]|jgi:hypothetical protein|nr:hypothetical protein [Thermoanaerobaculia bacterium]